MTSFIHRRAWFAPAALLLAVLPATYACGDESNAPPGSSSGDDPNATPGSGNNGESTSGGASGAPNNNTAPPDLNAAPGAACPARTEATQAVHVTMAVTWAGSVGKNPGSGTVHVWTRAKLTFGANNTFTTVNTPCGSAIPDIQTTPIAGGGKVQPEFLPVVWDSKSMVTFEGTGVQSSFDVNSKVNTTATPALVGLTMTDPNAAWPAAKDIKGTDSDGDSHLGITAIPKKGNGYSLPPTSMLGGKHADQLYIASRTTTSLSGVRDTCDSVKGTATVSAFDSHVIGCHVEGGGECAASDQQFIDDNRTVFKVTSATYEGKIVPDNSTCSDVRKVLPAN